jgi:hypothetical protein
MLGAGYGDPHAIVRPVHVFVGDDDDFVVACNAARRWGL